MTTQPDAAERAAHTIYMTGTNIQNMADIIRAEFAALQAERDDYCKDWEIQLDKAAQLRAERDAARQDAERLASILSRLGNGAHAGMCWASLHDFKTGFVCDCETGPALAAHAAAIGKKVTE